MKTLQELLDLRFGDIGAVPETLAGNEAIRRLAGRGVVRRFTPEPLPAAVLDTLAAVALSSVGEGKTPPRVPLPLACRRDEGFERDGRIDRRVEEGVEMVAGCYRGRREGAGNPVSSPDPSRVH